MPTVSRIVFKFLRTLLILLTGVLISCILSPLILLLVIISFPLRTFVQLVALISRPDLVEIFSGKGIFFALESVYTRPKLNIVVHFVLDGKLPTMEKIRLQFQQRILNHCDKRGKAVYAKLRQRWTQFCGFLFWQRDDGFRLENHMRFYDYTEPDLVLPEVCTEEDLKRVTAALIAKPFMGGRSPWEMLLIPRYKSASSSDCIEQMVGVIRIHHAMADGYSILKMLFKFLDLEGTRIPTLSLPKVSVWKKIFKGFVMPLRLPFDIAAQLFVDSVDGSNAWHLVGHKLSRKYEIFYSDPVPVWKIKEIKNRHRVGYNAAVYAVTIGAMRRLMIEAGQKVPKKMSCFVPFPLPNHPSGLVVHVSGFSFTFSPRKSDPVERLKQISKSFNAVQDSPIVPIVLSLSVDLLATLPVWVLRLLYNRMMMTMGMTSFPGAEEEVNVFGTCKLTDVIPAIGHPPGNIGVVGAMLSLAGKQRIVLTVDKEIFRSYEVPKNFATHINDEVEELLEKGREHKGKCIRREDGMQEV